MQRKKERATKKDPNRFMLMRMSEKQNNKKKLLNYTRLVRKYALIVAKLMLAIPMLIVGQPVQKKGIGKKCCLSLPRRKNGFASNFPSANMMQICANWEIHLSKGGKCRLCIPIYTGYDANLCKLGNKSEQRW